MLRFVYNPRYDNGKLSCHFICSRDLFDESTLATMARRFQHLISQLFSSNSAADNTDTCMSPVSKLSLILPEEEKEVARAIIRRLPHIVQEGMCSILLF